MYSLACFGDSLIQGFPFGNSLSWIAELEATKEIKTYNYGLCGDCADDIFDRLKYSVLPENVKHILFLGGANDALQGVPEKFTLQIIEKLVTWCKAKNYRLCIVLPLISSDERLNRRLLNLKQSLEVKFNEQVYLLDLQPAIGLNEQERSKAYLDGVHPTVQTYKAMGNYARPLLLTWLQQNQ